MAETTDTDDEFAGHTPEPLKIAIEASVVFATDEDGQPAALAAANAEIERLRAALVMQEEFDTLDGWDNPMTSDDRVAFEVKMGRKYMSLFDGGDPWEYRGRLRQHARELRRAALAGKDGAA